MRVLYLSEIYKLNNLSDPFERSEVNALNTLLKENEINAEIIFTEKRETFFETPELFDLVFIVNDMDIAMEDSKIIPSQYSKDIIPKIREADKLVPIYVLTCGLSDLFVKDIGATGSIDIELEYDYKTVIIDIIKKYTK